MADCDTRQNWDMLSPEERLAALTDAVNDSLADMGYEPVSVSIDDGGMDSDTWGETWMDDDGNVDIVLDNDLVENGSYDDAMGTAYHEAAHAQQYAEELESGENDEYEQLWEDDADAFAEEMLDETKDQCEPEPPDSAVDDGDSDFDFGAIDMGDWVFGSPESEDSETPNQKPNQKESPEDGI